MDRVLSKVPFNKEDIPLVGSYPLEIIVMILTMVILVAAIALKYLIDKKRERKDKERLLKEAEEEGFVTSNPSCQRISREQYKFEGEVHTKKEIKKLTSSAAYRDTLTQKGAKVENWNWQSRDALNGLLNLTAKKDEDFDIVEELFHVDQELKEERKA